MIGNIELKKLLIVYAHPDDESFGSGGLIAKYANEGVQVDYVCATDGDMGTPDKSVANETSPLSEIRLKELDCAKQALGIHQVIRLGYQDSGMMGSESNDYDNALWHQWQTNPENVLQRTVKILRDIQPQVIVTFNRYGGYGHPDHIAIQQATTQAFQLASDESYTSAPLASYTPQKLYYASIPAQKFYGLYLWTLRLRGKDVRRMGVNRDLDYQAVLDNLEPIHTLIDVGDYMTQWDQASDCHVSQGQGRGSGTRGMLANLPDWIRRQIAGRYGLTRIYPEPKHNNIDEFDLFDGIRVE